MFGAGICKAARIQFLGINWKPVPLRAALVALLTFAAYVPAFQAGFIWDDDVHVTANGLLQGREGLRRIWTEPTASMQYYPLTITTFWIEHRLWGNEPAGYHVVNVLLHATNAIVLGVLLTMLGVPGAWLAAAIFAVHPVMVESVAWISERKNVLSGFFYLTSMIACLRFLETRRWPTYAAAFVLFLLALASKTVTVTLPAAVLVVWWWKRGKLQRKDWLPLVPFFLAGLAIGLQTIRMEKLAGAAGADWSFSFLERVLIAGRAIWFYLANLIWPAPLAFIYPRWQIEVHTAFQWLFPVSALLILGFLWRAGRTYFAIALLFGGTLLPALGFLNAYPMLYSFVADHFQYLAAIAPITLAAAGITKLPGRVYLSAVLLAVLAWLSWRHAGNFRDSETLWRDTVAKNPDCWLAHDWLTSIAMNHGNRDEAEQHNAAALRVRPDDPFAHQNRGVLLALEGKFDEAIPHFETSLRLRPHDAVVHKQLGLALANKREFDRAAAECAAALAIDPRYAEAHSALGRLYAIEGKPNEAIAEFRAAIDCQPDFPEPNRELGNLFVSMKRFAEAAECFRSLVRLTPRDPEAHYQLARVCAELKLAGETRTEFNEAIRLKPDHIDALNSLAWLLATADDARVRDPRTACSLAFHANKLTGGNDAAVLDTFATALSAAGQTNEAAEIAGRASQRATETGNAELAGSIRDRFGVKP